MPHRHRPVVVALALAVATAAVAAELPTLAPGTWSMSGTVRLRACAAGRCQAQAQRVTDQVPLSPTVLAGTEGLLAACPADVGEAATGLTTLVPTRRGWFRLRVLDRAGVAQLMAMCLGAEFQLKRFAARVRVTPDGRTLDQRFVLGGRVRADGRSASIR